MATPRAVARGLRRSATKIAALPDPIVAEAAARAVELGADSGGSIARSRRPLTVEVSATTRRRGDVSATVRGVTTGGWSLKSYGRRGGYPIRPRRRGVLDLRDARTEATAARSAIQSGSTPGDDRWRRSVADPITDELSVIAEEQVADALE